METLNLFSQIELPGEKRARIIFTLPVTSSEQSNLSKLLLFSENFRLEEQTFFCKKKLKVVVVVYSLRMHKKRHTMTSVKAVQREITVYA